ncbi:hypothetical protein [Mycolicibacterium stellerae]|uniref:hypothetical protein n=1 Tax=Mycolicibacterium stellerae TaxID=2358193 RepID=UPI000F0AF8E3|nr:hypothetical protein [Mycolicibacterium stellerae]
MTTLDTEAGTNNQTPKTVSAPAPSDEKSTDTAALITEQQVLFGSAAALTPTAAPARHRSVARELGSTVHALFARPEKSRAPRHYPQRFGYLEKSAMSRAMDRL